MLFFNIVFILRVVTIMDLFLFTLGSQILSMSSYRPIGAGLQVLILLSSLSLTSEVYRVIVKANRSKTILCGGHVQV